MIETFSRSDTSRILVVDDDESTRHILRESLEMKGFLVEVAETGAEALGLFETHKPHLILLDVVMPGMDGFEVCRTIRSRRNGGHVPIVMITGFEDIESIKRAYEAGATDFVTKPINLFVLSERLRYMLRASQTLEMLRRSEARLAKAQKIARMGSWELDLETGDFHCSDETSVLCGLPLRDVKPGRKELMEHVHPEDRKALRKAVVSALREKRPKELDHRILLPGKGDRMVSHRIEVLADPDGNPQRIAATVQDITERKRGELLEAERNQILEMVIRGEPLREILGRLISMVEHQRPDAVCVLSILKGSQLHAVAPTAMPGQLAELLEGQVTGPRSGCCGTCAYFGRKVVVPNIAESPLWEAHRHVAIQCGIMAGFSVPILSGRGRILGTVALYYRKPSHPRRFEHSLLETASRLAAVAIEQRQLNEQLAHQAHHDALTGLPNRLLFADRLVQALAQAERHGGKVAVIYIDLDRFKHVNDFLGHHVGDLLLREIAERLKGCTRKSDTLARMGGDEFMLVLTGIVGREDASYTGQRLVEVLREPVRVENNELHVSASIGISMFPDDGEDTLDLQRKADIAMYCAKNGGGNRFQFFTEEMNAVVVERLELENDLRKALERGEFELHYQPQYDLNRNAVVGLEALLRWNHPEMGCIPPVRFVPIAEETGLIIPIGAWVLKEACRRNAQWQKAGFEPFKIAVNVSALQLSQVDFPQTVSRCLEETGMDPRWLELEVTESVLMRDVQSVTRSLVAIRSMGVSIAIDDFGNGYSSMSYLQWLPVDCLKIDQSFIQELENPDHPMDRSRTLIKAFVQLAENLGLRLLAEGVESREQCKCLKEAGCELGQGFLFSVPMTATEVESMCREQKEGLSCHWLAGGNGGRPEKTGHDRC
ncbi:MAG: EAL domain-containing protein [Deltaproteobacteria bacterium]|nr:EAL domain-containing protein [Deltaproteobacteria bacterium]